MSLELVRLNPYTISFVDAYRCSDALLDGFQDDDLYAAIFDIPLGSKVPFFHRIGHHFSMWSRLLLDDRLNYVWRTSSGRIAALSSWRTLELDAYDERPNWLVRFHHMLRQRAVSILARVVNNLFSILGLVPNPNRPEVLEFFDEQEKELPKPNDCEAFLSLMVVRRDYHRQGLGGKLLQAGIDRITEICADDGIKSPKFALYASPMGVGMYSKYGFRVMGQKDMNMGKHIISTSTLMVRERTP